MQYRLAYRTFHQNLHCDRTVGLQKAKEITRETNCGVWNINGLSLNHVFVNPDLLGNFCPSVGSVGLGIGLSSKWGLSLQRETNKSNMTPTYILGTGLIYTL